MCDYSLMHAKSRPATVGEKLIVKGFGRGTSGFAPASDKDTPADECTAVCVLPGTELVFDELPSNYWGTANISEAKTARFRQINKEHEHMHHDALEFGDGKVEVLTVLKEGSIATVLQLPAAPTTDAEREEQTRVVVNEPAPASTLDECVAYYG